MSYALLRLIFALWISASARSAALKERTIGTFKPLGSSHSSTRNLSFFFQKKPIGPVTIIRIAVRRSPVSIRAA